MNAGICLTINLLLLLLAFASAFVGLLFWINQQELLQEPPPKPHGGVPEDNC